MLRQLSLSKFRPFIFSSIRLAPLTFFVGENAIGKSRILSAFTTLRDLLKAQHPLTPKPNPPRRYSTISVFADEGAFSCSYQRSKKPDPNLEVFECTSADNFPMIQSLESSRHLLQPYDLYNSQDHQFSSDGANAAYLLEVADSNSWKLPYPLRSRDSYPSLESHAEHYLLRIIGPRALRHGVPGNSIVDLLSCSGSVSAFPIVAAGLFCAGHINNVNPVLLIQNPENNLHPSAQSRMGKFLALLACSGVQTIVETHSEQIIDGARIQLREKKKPDLLLVNLLYYSGEIYFPSD